MPEGPEVFTIVKGLQARIVGTTITNVIFSDNTKGIIDGMPKDAFVQVVQNDQIIDVVRRGKYIDIVMASGLHIVIHLLMTGQLIYKTNQHPNTRPQYLRAVLQFDNETELCLADKSTWVKLSPIWDKDIASDSRFVNLGVDVFSDEFTEEIFINNILKSRRAIHARLLDQKAISGLGNIYVNEVLFYAGIHPKRPANSLSYSEAQALYFAIYFVIREALKHNGTTFSDYRTPDGGKGQYQNYLKVFRRANKPCFRCGHTLRKTKISGRGAVFCPNDQPEHPELGRPSLPKQQLRLNTTIGDTQNYIFIITGPSSVGKTTLSRQMAEHIPFMQIVPTVKTRGKRPGEIEGVDSFFVSQDTFDQMRRDNQFVIFGQHFQHWYGTQREVVESILLSGKDAIIVVSLEGARELKTLYTNAFVICLTPPSQEALAQRIYTREDYSETEKHVRSKHMDMIARRDQCDIVIVAIDERTTFHTAFEYVYKIRCATDIR